MSDLTILAKTTRGKQPWWQQTSSGIAFLRPGASDAEIIRWRTWWHSDSPALARWRQACDAYSAASSEDTHRARSRAALAALRELVLV